MLSWIATSLVFTSVFLAGRRTSWAWVAGAAASAIWIVVTLPIGDAGLIAMNVGLLALYCFNFARDMYRLRRLNTPKVIHHINGDPYDNRAENLEMMSVSENLKRNTMSLFRFIPGSEQRVKRNAEKKENKAPVFNNNDAMCTEIQPPPSRGPMLAPCSELSRMRTRSVAMPRCGVVCRPGAIRGRGPRVDGRNKRRVRGAPGL